MVAPEDVPQHGNAESTGTFGKLKQTLSSSLLTAQDRGKLIHKKILKSFKDIFVWSKS